MLVWVFVLAIVLILFVQCSQLAAAGASGQLGQRSLQWVTFCVNKPFVTSHLGLVKPKQRLCLSALSSQYVLAIHMIIMIMSNGLDQNHFDLAPNNQFFFALTSFC